MQGLAPTRRTHKQTHTHTCTYICALTGLQECSKDQQCQATANGNKMTVPMPSSSCKPLTPFSSSGLPLHLLEFSESLFSSSHSCASCSFWRQLNSHLLYVQLPATPSALPGKCPLLNVPQLPVAYGSYSLGLARLRLCLSFWLLIAAVYTYKGFC